MPNTFYPPLSDLLPGSEVANKVPAIGTLQTALQNLLDSLKLHYKDFSSVVSPQNETALYRITIVRLK